ncbi:hypothetical protein EDD52_103131 [Primorskyibacter sedentarius]|uniref:Uncharacterized protein n=1 Tax=Primorskyibacter sedentarius TaxID=745311 RepID=A0A4R3JJL9_9RHOB|nr:hypothetical protein [Primorskyibacter sedentarius]TCS65715.1 hypothetical protein EDD52_103131 [Primorskyibacter sedentarius]
MIELLQTTPRTDRGICPADAVLLCNDAGRDGGARGLAAADRRAPRAGNRISRAVA